MAGPTYPAIVVSGDRTTLLSEVRESAARLASALRATGVQREDRVAILMRNETGFLVANAAPPMIGAVPVVANWHWTGSELRHLLSDSGVSRVICHTDLLPALEAEVPAESIIEAEVPPEVRQAYGLGDVPLTGRYRSTRAMLDEHPPVPGSVPPPLSVLYTSGSTGLAKGIVRRPVTGARQDAVIAIMRSLFKFEPGSVTLLPAPLYHGAPNAAASYALASDIDMVIMPRFDAEEFLRLVELHAVTTVQMVPTMFVRLLRLPPEIRHKYDLSSLKAIVHAAAPCPPDVKRAMIDWLGPVVYEYYGGSEGGPWVHCTTEEWLSHPGTVGRPMPDVSLRIVGPDGEELPPGRTGVIYGRSPAAWPEFTYTGDVHRRAEVDGGDGYITVGDVGHVDRNGFLYLSDRLNDLVISGGVNIFPAEVEAVLLGLDGVADAAVFGIPEPDLGEALAAHVQLLPGAALTGEQIQAHVREHLASYKVPKVVVFEDELPREDSGKLFKRRLKERYWTATRGS